MTNPAPPSTVLDVAAIRAQFPALERLHEGLPVAYFDGPGGTQVPKSVVAAMTDYLFHHNANTLWPYPTSQETDAMLAAARATLADFVGGAADEIVFGNNMTSLTFHLGRALGRGLRPGDEIVVTELDHHANVDPWRDLARERGLAIRVLQMQPATGQLDLGELERTLSGRTRLFCLGGASNVVGTLNDVRAAAALAHKKGALVFVDAVHSAPHQLVDVRAMGADLLACSAYKFYGPHVGILWGRRPLLEALDAPRLLPAPNTAPERLETGTQNHEGIAGTAAAVDFLASLAPGARSRRAALTTVLADLHERGQALVTRLWQGLRAAGARTFGPPPTSPRTPTVAFTVPGRPALEVATALARRALFVSCGDFYATTAVRRLGQAEHGLVRAGCACYTTAEEVDRLVAGVEEIARTGR